MSIQAEWGRFNFMTERDQVKMFKNELENLIHKYAAEFELSNASAIGCLMCQIMEIQKASEDVHDEG